MSNNMNYELKMHVTNASWLLRVWQSLLRSDPFLWRFSRKVLTVFVLSDLGITFDKKNVKQERKRENCSILFPFHVWLCHIWDQIEMYRKFISQQNDIISMLHFKYNWTIENWKGKRNIDYKQELKANVEDHPNPFEQRRLPRTTTQ